MTGDRDYDEDVSYWCSADGDDPMLEHLSDIEVIGLGDSYDDGRIDTLAIAYTELRQHMKDLARIAEAGASKGADDMVKAAWLTQVNLRVSCKVVNEDGSVETLDIDSLSMRGARREVTGYFIDQGYIPVDRWKAVDDESSETVRTFKAAGRKSQSP
jgi:hypothetical protein